jgi:hypothetical protein
MLKEALIALALTLSGGGAETRARTAVDAISVVIADVDATELYPELSNDPKAAKEKLGKLLIAWSYWESSWKHDALGDGGRSCGIMQVMPRTGGVSCDKLRSSAVAGFKAGLGVIRSLNKTCGGLRPALGAYASGKCGGMKTLVEKRCTKSGGC